MLKQNVKAGPSKQRNTVEPSGQAEASAGTLGDDFVAFIVEVDSALNDYPFSAYDYVQRGGE